MPRFEDTASMFGLEVGHGTSGEVKCGWCGKVYKEDPTGNETVAVDNFGGVEIAECCFEKVETAVIMELPRILPWFKRILESREARTRLLQKKLSKIKKLL